LQGDTFLIEVLDKADDHARLSHISRHCAKYNYGLLVRESAGYIVTVLVARDLCNCLFAASNNCAEAAKSSAGICDIPGRENTSCTSRKAAVRRVVVIGARSRGCVLHSSLVGLPLPGPTSHFQGQNVRAMSYYYRDGKSLA
jgi:hypothetical protein